MYDAAFPQTVPLSFMVRETTASWEPVSEKKSINGPYFSFHFFSGIYENVLWTKGVMERFCLSQG